LQMFHQRGQTTHALVTISSVSSLCSMFIVMSFGSSSQFGISVLSTSITPQRNKKDKDLLEELRCDNTHTHSHKDDAERISKLKNIGNNNVILVSF